MGRPWLQSVQHPLALVLRRGAHIVLLFLVAGEDADLHGSYPFANIENRPAPLSFVKLSFSA